MEEGFTDTDGLELGLSDGENDPEGDSEGNKLVVGCFHINKQE